jgi:hypothetical protein
MTWTFIWLMLILKIPIAGLAWIVWWAIHQTDDEPLPVGDEDGGTKLRSNRHPRPPLPRKPRRGPHGAAPAPTPSRVRTVHARARKVEH